VAQEQVDRDTPVSRTPTGPNPSPEEVAALRFIIQEQKDQISSERQILE
jgi:hypothetical protein